MTSRRSELDDILLAKAIISREELSEARLLQDEKDLSLSEALLELGLIDDYTIADLIASQRGLDCIELESYHVDREAIVTISEKVARKYEVLPIDYENSKLKVAVVDPSNIVALDDLHILTGKQILTVVAARSELLAAINKYYKVEHLQDSEFDDDIDDGEMEIAKGHLLASSDDAPVIKLVDMIAQRAVRQGASDIHIEPQEENLRVRFRVDGVLHEIMDSPRNVHLPLVSRFKLIASMDIAESRKPQDGHCVMRIEGKDVDFRVATLPTVYGERVVLRILEKESILLKLEQLGFSPESLEQYRSAYTQPYGAILVTGPTGSGKSTTLYATLNVLNDEAKNIITIEDPVEYRLPGINQIQINARAGLSFAKGLRSILRATPDIVMVGEIRDKETAQIAIEAALTGHLVLSTLHTNDAPGAVSRLTEMGTPPFLIVSALDCVLAQRLARRLCGSCKVAYEPSQESLEALGFPLESGASPTLYKAGGCQRCGHTGFKGRLGVYEIMLMSEEIEQLAIARKPAEEIKKVAVAQGMKTLRDDGFEKARQGMTSIDEIMRVVA